MTDVMALGSTGQSRGQSERRSQPVGDTASPWRPSPGLAGRWGKAQPGAARSFHLGGSRSGEFSFLYWCGIPEGCPCLKSVEMLELNPEKLLQRAVTLEKKAGGPQRQGDSLAVFHS